MNIISGNRGSGKTTRIIKRSAETGYPIIVSNKSNAMMLKEKAFKLGVSIPEPYIYDVYHIDNSIKELSMTQNKDTKFIIDEVYYFVKQALGINLDTVSMTTDESIAIPRENIISKLYEKYNKAIEKEDYGTALNIMKNIDMLNNQIRQDKELN